MQIRHILEDQGMYMKEVWRYKAHTLRYNIYTYDGELVASNITMNGIRLKLTELNYPLDYDPVPPKRKRKK